MPNDIQIVLGYKDYGSGINIKALNWDQTVITNAATHGHKNDVPFSDGVDNMYPHYASPDFLDAFRANGYMGKQFNGKYDLLFYDIPSRNYGTNDYYWRAILSLISTGTNSRVLATLQYDLIIITVKYHWLVQLQAGNLAANFTSWIQGNWVSKL